MGNKIKRYQMKFAVLAALASVTVANDAFFFGEDEDTTDADLGLVMADDVDEADLEDISLTEEEIAQIYGEDEVEEDAEVSLTNFKVQYPQCRMFRNLNNGMIYLTWGGSLHHIPDHATWMNLFHASMDGKWTNQPHTTISKTNIGQNIKPGAFLGKGNLKPEVYLVSYKGHHIANVKTFNTCGFDWNKIKTFPQAKVNAFPKDHDIDVTLY